MGKARHLSSRQKIRAKDKLFVRIDDGGVVFFKRLCDFRVIFSRSENEDGTVFKERRTRLRRDILDDGVDVRIALGVRIFEVINLDDSFFFRFDVFRKLVERGLNLLMVFRIGDGEDFARGRVKFKSSVGNECL